MAQYVCCVEFSNKTDNWCGKEEHYEGKDIQKKLNIEEVYSRASGRRTRSTAAGPTRTGASSAASEKRQRRGVML